MKNIEVRIRYSKASFSALIIVSTGFSFHLALSEIWKISCCCFFLKLKTKCLFQFCMSIRNFIVRKWRYFSCTLCNVQPQNKFWGVMSYLLKLLLSEVKGLKDKGGEASSKFRFR